MQSDDWCYICQKHTLWVKGTDRHHCLHGTANRKLADKDGLTVMLCHDHHMRLHDTGEWDKELQREAQIRWMEYYERSIDEFRKRYGKNYLE